jgi:Polyketide cyclase / dehydrase and lipid transport
MNDVVIEDEIAIESPALAVWEAIRDPAMHARWHPFVIEIRGEHGLGLVRTCSVLVSKQQGQTKERCVEDDRGNRIAWVRSTRSSPR